MVCRETAEIKEETKRRLSTRARKLTEVSILLIRGSQSLSGVVRTFDIELIADL